MTIGKTAFIASILAVLAIGGIGIAALTTGDAQDTDPTQFSPIHIDNTKEAPDAQETPNLESLAKISKEEAQKIALNETQGSIKGTKLENEDGNIVYNVAVANGNSETEVKIDAGNGKILKTEKEETGKEGNKGENGPEEN